MQTNSKTTIQTDPKIFKAYDIRGVYNVQFDHSTAYKIGQAYTNYIKPKKVAIGRDVRSSGEEIKTSLIEGLNNAGVDVVDIGVISTDMLYFAVAHYGFDGGIVVSASHNPREYNGFKMVREKSIAISSDTGLNEIRDMVLNEKYEVKSDVKGKIEKLEIVDDYVNNILSFVDINSIKPMKVVLSANFGMAGIISKKILSRIPANIEYVCLDCEPDGNFPKGRPDPLIPDRRIETSEMVISEKADLAVAWDADADRCFFFDENGDFVEGYFIVGLLAKTLLADHPGGKILYDPRLTWATIETVENAGGIPICTKAGHTFIKDRMRKEDAIFAGEMSAHYYFRDYWYADNGMIPFLMVMEILSKENKTLSDILKPVTGKYFVSGEINTLVNDPEKSIQNVREKYKDGRIETIDGLSIEFDDWRFNLRPSNTEPVIRLNVESTKKELMEQKRDEILPLLKS
jgi:phosphomannomutase